MDIIHRLTGRILVKDKTMDNVHKHNTCISVPSSQTFRSYLLKRVLYSPIKYRVAHWKSTDVSEEHVATGSKQRPLQIVATYSSETSVDFRRITRRYIPEDRAVHNHRYENLNSYKAYLTSALHGCRMASFTPRPPYTREKSPHYPLDTLLGESGSRYKLMAKKKVSASAGYQTRVVNPVAQSLYWLRHPGCTPCTAVPTKLIIL
jgi:hypothetical protein